MPTLPTSRAEKVGVKGDKRISIKSVRKEGSADPSGGGDGKNVKEVKVDTTQFKQKYISREESQSRSGVTVEEDFTDMSIVRTVFLRLLSVVYFSAFLSFYLQIEGLYGSKGVTPAKAELRLSSRSSEECVRDKSTLLCFLVPQLGLSVHHAMELLALAGVLISALASMCSYCCLISVMAAQWILYLTLYQVGGVFLWFQWDILLLETGFLAILVAPWLPTKSSQSGQPRDLPTLFMVKWLLFRLMFSSGVVKLMSGCPTWWGLTALNYHFESQCLPTPLSPYVHGLPQWILRLMVVGTYFVEIIVPFVFLTPFTLLQRIGFWLQILFQIAIISTGNYNFFNFLTMVLCVSLLDNEFFNGGKPRRDFGLFRFLKRSISFSLIGLGGYFTWYYFGLNLTAEKTVDSKIAFTRLQFDEFLSYAVPVSIVLGVLNLASAISKGFIISLFELKGVWRKLSSFTSLLIYGFLCCMVFSITLVPYSALHKETGTALWPQLRELSGNLSKLHLTSSYGLFRRMTGTENGRPEVILEYSDNQGGPWKEFQFLYKPGDVSNPSAFIVPYQPRIDWQMWFAALQTYHETPWLISLSYRLLQGEESVQKLLDAERNPQKAPKYIRASLYHYKYTKVNSATTDTWSRSRTQEYMPTFSVDHPTLVEFIRNLGYLENDLPPKVKVNESLTNILDSIRSFLQSYRPEFVIWGSLVSIFLLVVTSKLFK